MTAVTAPGSRASRSRSLLGSAISVLSRSPRLRRRVLAVADKVRDNVVTVAAFASFDFGVYQLSHAGAWMTALPLVLILEWKFRGE